MVAEKRVVNNRKPDKYYWKSGKYLSILTPLLVLLVWFIFTREGLGLVKDYILPSPLMVIQAVGKTRKVLLMDIIATLSRVFISITAGTLIGIFVAFLMSYYKRVEYALNPIIESFRPVPIVAMIPFFLMWFGVAEIGKLLLATMGVFCIMVVNTFEAIKNVPNIYILAAKTLGARKFQVYKDVILHAMIPSLIGPFRTSMAMAFTLVVAAEFMGAQSGLGFRILDARRLFNTDVIMMGIIFFGVISAAIDAAIRKLTNYMVRWSERE